ncbi:MAG: OmpA family protein [Phaeodactylibacter sp.]|nr:OmpA family protein [Phaeodactylibacter sp.]
MKAYQKITLWFLLLACLQSCGGSRWLDRADEAYENHDFQKAAVWYEKGLEKAYKPEAFEKLGYCYYRNGQYADAAQWFEKAMAAPGASPQTRLQYALCLQTMGRCEEARRQAGLALIDIPGDQFAASIVEACRQQDSLGRADDACQASLAPFNSPVSDFAPAWMGDVLVFASERGGGEAHDWTGRAYVDLYYWREGMAAPQPLEGEANSKWHDGPAAFAGQGQVMYFTRNTSGRERTGKLEILEARSRGGRWEVVKALSFNDKKSTAAHPAISADGQLMVFASDRPDGFGGMDLYYALRQGEEWSEPQNLGLGINTSGHEVFPFLSEDGRLYFSSDGLPGLGGLDLFVAEPQPGAARWGNPRNLRPPFNSRKDDFGLLSRDGLRSGYFSSNRDNSQGIDNIYQFSRNEEIPIHGVVMDQETQLPLGEVAVDLRDGDGRTVLSTLSDAEGKFRFSAGPGQLYELQGKKNGILTTIGQADTREAVPGQDFFVILYHNDPRFTLNGHALERQSGQPVEGVLVKLLNTGNNREVTALTDEEGRFSFQLEQHSDYLVSGTRDGLFSSYKQASTRGLNRSTTLYVKLVLSFEEVELGKAIRLENILFDFDQADIRPDAARELDHLARFLKDNPNIRVEMGSHTDSRGSDDYNLRLSQERAESTLDYLVRAGIARRRLSARGYGETRLANHCGNGVECTETQHQANRRTEFTVTGVSN